MPSSGWGTTSASNITGMTGVRPGRGLLLVGLLLAAAGLLITAIPQSQRQPGSGGPGPPDPEAMQARVRSMFDHAFDSYMKHAFPHDELKPLSQGWTDSLAELGGSSLRPGQNYSGVALSLVDALSTLAVLAEPEEGGDGGLRFREGVREVLRVVRFDQDVRVNVFETNIRMLGGLLSAHLLAPKFFSEGIGEAYGGELLELAYDLGARLLRAFPLHSESEPPSAASVRKRLRARTQDLAREERQRGDGSGKNDRPRDPASEGRAKGERLSWAGTSRWTADRWCRNRLPFAWVNLQHGLDPKETGETCTAGAGTLVLEFGMLSWLSGDPRFWEAADDAMWCLWMLRGPLDLPGNTLDLRDGNRWLNQNAGIGAGIDSFFEYLYKAYVLFGDPKYLLMFRVSYDAARQRLRLPADPHWYVEANMRTGQTVYRHFNSLQAFWPGLQATMGDLAEAHETYRRFRWIWRRFDGLPERFLLDAGELHPTENYYPQRPELIESAYYLWEATGDPGLRRDGLRFVETFERHSWVPGGFASVRNVGTHQLEDRQNSFFLAETCLYAFLLFRERPSEHWLHSENWLFNTEGHPLPVLPGVHRHFRRLRWRESRRIETAAATDPPSSAVVRAAQRAGVSLRHWFEPKQLELARTLDRESVCPEDPERAARGWLQALSPDWFVSRLLSPAGHQSGEHQRLELGDIDGDDEEGDAEIASLFTLGAQKQQQQQLRAPPESQEFVIFNTLSSDFQVLHRPTGELLQLVLSRAGALRFNASELSVELEGEEASEDDTERQEESEQAAIGVYLLSAIPGQGTRLLGWDAPRQRNVRWSVRLRVETGHSGEPEECRTEEDPFRQNEDLADLELSGAPSAFAPGAALGESRLSMGPSELGCAALDAATARKVAGRVLLVLRGGCSFAVKALWAQRAGATGLLVVNHVFSTSAPSPHAQGELSPGLLTRALAGLPLGEMRPVRHPEDLRQRLAADPDLAPAQPPAVFLMGEDPEQPERIRIPLLMLAAEDGLRLAQKLGRLGDRLRVRLQERDLPAEELLREPFSVVGHSLDNFLAGARGGWKALVSKGKLMVGWLRLTQQTAASSG